jgi:hypothetical protein
MHGSMNIKSGFYALYSLCNSIQISCHKPETDVCYVVVTIRCDDQACYVPTRPVLHLFMYQFISLCSIFVRSVTSHLTLPVHSISPACFKDSFLFFSLHSSTLQEATNPYLDHTLLDNKFATYSAGKHEPSAHSSDVL